MKKIMKMVILLMVVSALFSCYQPFSKDRGALSISINNGFGSKTLVPGLDIVPTSYRITGAGPEGAAFDVNTTSGSVTIDFLRFGEWTINIEAFNAGGTIIGAGSSDAYVNVEGVTNVPVTIRLLEGVGAFDLQVSWPLNEVENPQLTGMLRPASGSDIPLDFGTIETMDPVAIGHANTGNVLPAGYYTLIVKVKDLGVSGTANHLAAGVVEVAKILKSQTTYGNYNLQGVPGMGKIDVQIEQDFNDPIEVIIENSAALPTTLVFDGGASFTVSATVPAEDADAANITYVWYLNGESIGLDNNVTIGMDNSPLYQNINGKFATGHYRLDVTAFNADGSRAGSTNFEFNVTGDPARITSGDTNDTSPVTIEELESGSSSSDSYKSAAISGDGNVAVVGDYSSNYSRGSVSVYRKNGQEWEISSFAADDVAEYGRFGYTTALSYDGSVMAVGAVKYYYLDSDDRNGSVYIYRRNGLSWDETKILPADLKDTNGFGSTLTLSDDGNMLVVSNTFGGDYLRKDTVFFYEWNGTAWEETKFVCPEKPFFQYYGRDVDISADKNTVVIGAANTGGVEKYDGAIYIFRRNGDGWTQELLYPSYPTEMSWSSGFGCSVSISDDGTTIAVGAYGDDNIDADYSGSVFIYRWDGTQWLMEKINNPEPARNDFFGIDVAISGDANTLVVSSYRNSPQNIELAGTVYIYTRTESGWFEKKVVSGTVENQKLGCDIGLTKTGDRMIAVSYTGPAHIIEDF